MGASWPGGPSAWQREQSQRQRQRAMEAAWWEKKQREQAEAGRRAQEEAERRARQHEGARVEQPAGWRPPVQADGQLSESPRMPASRGFLRELPRRAARIALLVFALIAVLNAMAPENSDEVLFWIYIAILALVGAVVLRSGRRGAKYRSGTATNVVAMPGSGNMPSSLSFRLERYDSRGARLPPVPVEMKGGGIKGQLLDGDEVRAVGGRIRGGALHPRTLVNLRTGERVRLGRRVGHWVGAVLAWLLSVAIAVLIILVLTS